MLRPGQRPPSDVRRAKHRKPVVNEKAPIRLRDALRKARIEAADRTGVVVDLRDAEVARLEILNEALDPLFGQIPDQVELFDRGISQGDTPRLWIDVVAHVVMGRDKRIYRLVQDTRFGRIVLAESHEVARDGGCRDRLCRAPPDRARARAGGDAAGRSPSRRGREAAPRPVLDRSCWDSCSARWRCSAFALFASLRDLLADQRNDVWVDAATIGSDLCHSSEPSLVATRIRVAASNNRSAVSGTRVAQ